MEIQKYKKLTLQRVELEIRSLSTLQKGNMTEVDIIDTTKKWHRFFFNWSEDIFKRVCEKVQEKTTWFPTKKEMLDTHTEICGRIPEFKSTARKEPLSDQEQKEVTELVNKYYFERYQAGIELQPKHMERIKHLI